MKINRKTGRYTLVHTKWLRVQFSTNKVKEGYSFQCDVGPRYRGPGIWVETGTHWSATVWLAGDTSAEMVSPCGRCASCKNIFDLPENSGRTVKMFFSF